jgi:hypothetical protein
MYWVPLAFCNVCFMCRYKNFIIIIIIIEHQQQHEQQQHHHGVIINIQIQEMVLVESYINILC